MKTPFSQLTFFLSIILLGLNACSANKVISHPPPVANGSTDKTRVLDLTAIQPLESISPKLKLARTVLVGELHTNYAHHLNQLAVIKSAHRNWGNNTSIGLEMVQQPYQHYLDNYVAGKINERDMLRGVQWYDRWKYDFRLYRPIFNYAKQHKLPLVALNVPAELTKRISKVGIKGLTAEERKQLPKTLDKSNPAYLKRLKDVFSMHSHGYKSSKGFDKFLDSQLAWDEGMAFAATKYLRKNPAKRMVILAGAGHIVNREGIPSRLDRQLGTRSLVILNNSGDVPSAAEGDYLLFAPEEILPPAGLIGISMAEANNGVKVAHVSTHGAASKAGIKTGDIILALDQQIVKSPSDISLWRLDKKPNDEVKIKLKRQNQVLFKTLKLGKASNRMSFSMGKVHKK